ncbi:hypothetical protein ACQP1K_07775 [Sphaerimonospora sp. CA-214678]|uniref:hypothetical protein n=1 Tax=Sphaerimonospora sp. CA-214678 TaxID=3240029 RepID=UPI003D8E8ED8
MTERTRRPPTGDAEETSIEELRRLRQDYPGWGFLIIADDRWTAVRGRHTLLQAPTAQELRRRLPPRPGAERAAAGRKRAHHTHRATNETGGATSARRKEIAV